MSWSTGVHLIDKDQIGSIEAPANTDPAAQKSQDEQVTAVIRAVEDLASVVGRSHDQVSVSMSGHANPDHAPRDGWSNETITISISAVPVPERGA